ncbi:hypothetical protein CEXT_779631 [Caerostris extrusa]|uniref:Uncharacterized protein n=1 Tax=Caerostris extrusa TaxID=172846 RepID=A0AAV4WH20_CAEEX|nr:hypothetical protein CEXT_779631 [Caerostris extrusa]
MANDKLSDGIRKFAADAESRSIVISSSASIGCLVLLPSKTVPFPSLAIIIHIRSRIYVRRQVAAVRVSPPSKIRKADKEDTRNYESNFNMSIVLPKAEEWLKQYQDEWNVGKKSIGMDGSRLIGVHDRKIVKLINDKTDLNLRVLVGFVCS